MGSPKDIHRYRLESINGIEVYIGRDFESPFSLTIDVGSLLGFKTLHIDGWKLI